MLEHGGEQIVPVIPQLVIPLKDALNTRDKEIITRTLHIIKKMLKSNPLVGQVCLFCGSVTLDNVHVVTVRSLSLNTRHWYHTTVSCSQS